MEKEYYVSGMECESCAKVISNVISRFPGARFVGADNASGKIVFECEDGDESEILRAVQDKGYALSKSPVTGKTSLPGKKTAFQKAGAFLSGIASGKSEYAVERNLVENALLTFFLSVGMQFLILILFAPAAPGVYKWLLLLLSFGISANAFTAWHSVAYRKNLSCMTGMMVGMTLGMMSGFMIGAVIGASNGMFVGSAAGMAVGMLVGAYCGYCCGVMGLLEGLMAGIMAGVMGAMTSVMLVNDHPIEFLSILFFSCAVVLTGLGYLVYKEAGGTASNKTPDVERLVLNVAVVLALSLLMLYGPRGPVVWVGG